MIMEGLVNKTWSFKDQTLIKSKIEDYLKQRDSKMIADFDDKGRVLNLKPVEGL